MKILPRFLLLVCLYLIGTSIVLSETYDNELSKLSASLGSSVEQAGLKTVAISGVKDLQGKDSNLGKLIAEDLSVDLVNQQKGVTVVDRANLNRIMEEYKLTEEGLIDPENIKKLKLAGIDAIIVGTITPFEGTYRVALKAITTDSAKVVAATRGSITQTEDLDKLMGITTLQSTKSGQTTQMPKVATADGTPVETPKSNVYDLGTTTVEIKAVNFLRKSGKVRVIFTITNKTDEHLKFVYNLIDENAGPNSPQFYDPSAFHGNQGKPKLKFEGEATDDKGQTYKLLLPSDSNSTPNLTPGEPVSFTIEYQMVADAGATVQVPETFSFSFEFFATHGMRDANYLYKFSTIDSPIGKVQ